MAFDTLISDIVATIIGGGLLALVFFWIREYFFVFPNISGRWYYELVTENTSYRPYEKMVLRYMAILWREGNLIQGTVEKIYEDSSTGERSYDGENRTRGLVGGYFEKNYFSKDRIYLHVVEDGHGRKSTSFLEIEIADNDRMVGTFISMVAGQDGKITFQRNTF